MLLTRLWVSEVFFSDLHLIWESFFFVAGKAKCAMTHLWSLPVCILTFASTSLLYLKVFLLIRTQSNCLSAPFWSAVCGLDHDRLLHSSKNRHVISISSVADLGHRPSLKNEKMRRCGDRKRTQRTWTLGDLNQHVATSGWVRLRVLPTRGNDPKDQHLLVLGGSTDSTCAANHDPGTAAPPNYILSLGR